MLIMNKLCVCRPTSKAIPVPFALTARIGPLQSIIPSPLCMDSLHALRCVAPLKHDRGTALPGGGDPLHALRCVAPLKRDVAMIYKKLWLNSPRTSVRGSVEAVP